MIISLSVNRHDVVRALRLTAPVRYALCSAGRWSTHVKKGGELNWIEMWNEWSFTWGVAKCSETCVLSLRSLPVSISLPLPYYIFLLYYSFFISPILFDHYLIFKTNAFYFFIYISYLLKLNVNLIEFIASTGFAITRSAIGASVLKHQVTAKEIRMCSTGPLSSMPAVELQRTTAAY